MYVILRNQWDCENSTGSTPDMIESDSGPENMQIYEHEQMDTNADGSPEQVFKCSGPGALNAGTPIPDSLSDPDELPDDADIMDDSNLQQFATALQEAQLCAVQLESEEAAKKRKTLKTYLGKLKKNQLHHDKACKVLASQGFHDVFTFMALKQRAAICSCRGGLEDYENTGLGFGAGASAFPGPADQVLEMVWDADTSTGASAVAGGIPGGGGGGLRILKTKSDVNALSAHQSDLILGLLAHLAGCRMLMLPLTVQG